MGAENQNEEAKDQQNVQDDGNNSILQNSIVKLVIRFLGWLAAVLAGIAILVFTQNIVLDLRGDAPDPGDLTKSGTLIDQPVYDTHPLDVFSITLDKMDEMEKTTAVTVQLVLAYPEGGKDVANELNERRAQIADRIQSIIATQRYEDINTADKRETTLKLELINEINRNLINKGIVDIYITRFEISRY